MKVAPSSYRTLQCILFFPCFVFPSGAFACGNVPRQSCWSLSCDHGLHWVT